MTGNELFDLIGDIKDEYIFEAEKYDKPRIPRKNRAAWIAAAACFCLVLGIGFFNGARLLKSNGKNGDYVSYDGSYEASDKIVTDKDVISSYDGKNSSQASCYMTPTSGEYFCFAELDEAIEAYSGQDVVFLVGIDIFSNESALSKEETDIELKRLYDAGYSAGYVQSWTYEGKDGKKKSVSYAAGLFTAEQLKNFEPNEKYGYAFHFITNGDGTPINPDSALDIEFWENTASEQTEHPNDEEGDSLKNISHAVSSAAFSGDSDS
ncbi:MAG: hypothetical protein ACI4QV_00885 [Acutalibacteraceae bacterium]